MQIVQSPETVVLLQELIHDARIVPMDGRPQLELTLNDPAAWTQPWPFMIRLKRSDGQLYEYACHEANYSMTGILAGARADEAKAAAAAAKKGTR